MKFKNKFMGVLSLVLLSTSISGCQNISSSKDPYVCTLRKDIEAYDQFQFTANTIEDRPGYLDITIKNVGDKYAVINMNEYEFQKQSNISVSRYEIKDNLFDDYRVLAPNESISIVKNSTENPEYINKHGKLVCGVYSLEYTGMQFENITVEEIPDEDRYSKYLLSDLVLKYKPNGKWVHGHNYHLLINYTYDGVTGNVISSDPNYEDNGFGLELYYKYRYYGSNRDMEFDINKLNINWVKCYTAWRMEKQPYPCREIWRAYRDKKKSYAVSIIAAIAVPLVGVGGGIGLAFYIKKKKKEKLQKADW